jgi:uncharacterized protein
MPRQLRMETRTTPLAGSWVNAESDGNTLVGYPIVFDTWAEISDASGRYRERISPTALTKTLADNGDRIRVQFDHGTHPSIGSLPLGKPSVMRVDRRGLYVEVPLSATSYNEDLTALIRDGAIDGMSFRFQVINEKWNRPKTGLPERTITELKLFEFGPVVYPAYSQTTVGVRTGRACTPTEKQAANVAKLRQFAAAPAVAKLRRLATPPARPKRITARVWPPV